MIDDFDSCIIGEINKHRLVKAKCTICGEIAVGEYDKGELACNSCICKLIDEYDF